MVDLFRARYGCIINTERINARHLRCVASFSCPGWLRVWGRCLIGFVVLSVWLCSRTRPTWMMQSSLSSTKWTSAYSVISTSGEINRSWDYFIAAAFPEVSAPKSFGWSFCSSWLSGAAMRDKFCTNRRKTLQRLENERSLVIFVGGFNDLIGSVVWKTVPHFSRHITWSRWSAVLVTSLHLVNFKTTPALFNRPNVCRACAISRLGEHEKTTISTVHTNKIYHFTGHKTAFIAI